MIRWAGLALWGFELPFSGSLTSTFLVFRTRPESLGHGGRSEGKLPRPRAPTNIATQMLQNVLAAWNKLCGHDLRAESSQFEDHYSTEICSDTEAGAYVKLIDFCITQL